MMTSASNRQIYRNSRHSPNFTVKLLSILISSGMSSQQIDNVLERHRKELPRLEEGGQDDLRSYFTSPHGTLQKRLNSTCVVP